MTLLELADAGFFVLHTALMVFNMVGWIWRRTRVAHLVTLGLTTFSWFVLGYWYGIGFCICTHWHFQVREALGRDDHLIDSYLQLLAKHWFGVDMSRSASDWSAGIVYVLVVLATATVWTLDLTRRRRQKSAPRRFRTVPGNRR